MSSFSFTASQALLLAAVRAKSAYDDSDEYTWWKTPSCFIAGRDNDPDRSLTVDSILIDEKLFDERTLLVRRAHVRFEREFGHYAVEKKTGVLPAQGSIAVVREYHRLLIHELDLLSDLLDGRGDSSGV